MNGTYKIKRGGATYLQQDGIEVLELEVTPLSIDGAWLVKPKTHTDSRGQFREWFKPLELVAQIGRDFSAAQGNISTSKKGTLRGIHYSLAAQGQAKWVTCLSGRIKDVVVDIRVDSPSFGKSVTLELNGTSGQVLLIGEGLGHGFLSMEEDSLVAYLVSSPYSPFEEFEINPFDAELNIDWGTDKNELKLSPKDASAPSLLQLKDAGKLPKIYSGS